MLTAAVWGGLSVPGYALPSGGGLLLALAVLAYAMSGKKGGGGRPNKELNESIERVVGGVARGIGRYVTGRDLAGEPRSTATWWRSGILVDDDGEAAFTAPAPAVSLEKPADSRGRRVLRGVLLPVRVVASMVRALGAWTRWPHAARCLVRLAPLPVAWGLWRHPGETWVVLAAAAVVVLLVALAGPGGLGWWAPRTPSDDEVFGPALWAAVRQVLRLDENETRSRWLRIDPDLSADGARIVLRLPQEWMGGKDAMGTLAHVVDTRIPGEWVAQWDRAGASQHVSWTRKKAVERPVLPEFVEWKPSPSRYEVHIGQAIEDGKVVDVMVHTHSATPHWGVGGDTGSGKSTVLYIPIVHGRQHGELVDILDTKQNSLQEAEGFSGVRVHKTVRSCIAAFAEFMVSMMAAESALGKNADPAARAQLIPRLLVIDELPTLIKMAYVWWRYGLKGKGAPPFLEWFSIILLQGRSSDHRIVVGTQQFANTFFGGTMERAQIGTKMVVGLQDRVSWGVAFGQSTPVIQYDTTVKGRGAFSDKRQAPDSEHLYVREIQPAYITPRVAEYLAQCPPAPAWFDAGGLAPWITAEALKEADLVATVSAFLPGGAYGPDALPTVTHTGPAPLPSSGQVTGPGVTGGVTSSVTAAAGADEAEEDAALPPTYSLAEACAQGIVPWGYSTARQYKKRSQERNVAFPEGVPDGRTTYYTEEELREWVTLWKASMTRS
ncbi:type IV secretory system conjugative DNA transfer family protein [Streptomyces laurentii]|uniref:type IV secretory system conjugative DNA transfer family protein n=1 Tax=Streptomyces laurentii TaxID=39478 RepID=UPI0036CA8C98